MKNDIFNKYLENFENIEGWFDMNMLKILQHIDKYQKEKGITGSIVEIGVHHGKSFIPLYLLKKKDEFALAIDCFENQKFNYDSSGKGDCSIFMKNIKKYNINNNFEKLKIIKGDSTKLKPKAILKKIENQRIRIFSIDGCHESKATLKDLNNAKKTLTKGGIIMIDDYFNNCWPGVSEGVNKFLQKQDRIKPFFIGFNKILLSDKRYVKKYLFLIGDNVKPYKKISKFFDTKVVIY